MQTTFGISSPTRDTEEKQHFFRWYFAGMSLIAKGMKEGILKERDMFTVFVLMSQAHPWTGHIWVSAKVAFEEFGSDMSAAAISSSISRLKKANIVKRFEQRRMKTYSYAINPRLVGIGPDDAQRRLWEKWQADKI